MRRDGLSWVQIKSSYRGENNESLQAGLYFLDGIGAGNCRKRSHIAIH